MKQLIRLRGISDDVKGKVWESDNLLRAGRLGSLEIVLDDSSVSRRHAELRYVPASTTWALRDLESTNGTYLNGARLGAGEKSVRARDIVQFGKVAMIVETTEVAASSDPQQIDQILVEATTHSSFEEAISNVLPDKSKSPQLMALIKASHFLIHAEKEDDLLHKVLQECVTVLEAQRGAIVLADGDGKLKLRALASGKENTTLGRFHFSQKLAARCFEQGESILCCKVSDDTELAAAQSIADGQMASVLCILLRTPRNRLGILHLDRTYWQKAFTKDDLHFADALAVNASMGIEVAQLLRYQRQQFLDTITVLAQAVELKDEYTGGHTARVTNYAMMLGAQLGLPQKQLDLIRIGAPLHDIGKIGIDDAILRKPGRLTPEEFEIMKTHTVKGAAIVSTIPSLHPVIPIVRSHHERWDGGGYPDKLAGEEIHQLARIVAVVDAFDAMTSNRPYHLDKRGKTPEVAFAEVEKQAGRQFDPQCAAGFLAIREQVVDAMRPDRQTALVGETMLTG